MSNKTLWRWEQAGAGDEHGTATYFPDTPHEITVSLPTFKMAHDLYESMSEVMKQTRYDARAGLLAQIARIEP